MVFTHSHMSLLNGLGSSGYDWSTFTGDDFTGNNGDPLNPAYWIDQSSTHPFLIQSNAAQITNLAGAEFAIHDSKWVMSGDFDIQIDFSGWDAQRATSPFRWYMLDDLVAPTAGCYIGVVDAFPNFKCNFLIASVWGSEQSQALNHTNGKLRLVRVDGNVTTYWITGNNPPFNLWKVGAIGTNSLYTRLYCDPSHHGETGVDMTLDNYLINSGTPGNP